MLSTQHTTFSAAQRAQHSSTLVVVNSSDSAAEQFTNVLDQLLGKSTKIAKSNSINEIDTRPAELLYQEKEQTEETQNSEQLDTALHTDKEAANQEESQTQLDASTVATLVKQEQIKTKENQEVVAQTQKEGGELAKQNLKVALEQKPQGEVVTGEAFKLVKQQLVTNQQERGNQPTDPLQQGFNNAAKIQSEHAQNRANSASTSQESELKIEMSLERSSGTKDFLSPDTRPILLKASSSANPLGTLAPVASNLNKNLSSEIAKLATSGSMSSKLLQDITKEREPVASLSLLGEKNKVQTPKESSKTKELTSRQEQIINQILKLIDQAAKLKDGSTLSIRVKPEELGEVLVKVSQRGDQLFARIIPESKEVEQTVRKGINEVIAQLVAAGFKPDNIHVSVGKELSESESFSNLNRGQFEQNSSQSSEDQNLFRQNDRHGSSLDNPSSSGSKLDSKNAFSTLNSAVDNGWVA